MSEQTTPNVSPATISRLLILILAIANNILVMLGVDTIPIADEQVNQAVAILWTIGASLWSYWKDNPWTKASRAKHAA